MNRRDIESPFKVRPLVATDLDLVVEIDAAAFGHPRRPYFERRLAAALREPALNVQVGIEDRGTLAGFVLARKLEGEFGRPDPALRLEVIGVDTSEQAHGIGTQLLEALEAEAKKREIHELRTQAPWRDHVMLRFLDHHGFSLGKNQVIDCAVEAGAFGPSSEAAFAAPERVNQARELDYSAPEANDYEQMARDVADVRTLARGDLPDLARIDHKLTGRDRSSYITHQFDETLFDAAIRVSLAARVDGVVAGFLMANVDRGDFGRNAPVAVIDTLGVDPDYAGRGLGRAMLSQLMVNLAALRVERVETVVSRMNFDVLSFFYKAGFEPSERLAFMKALA
ncbi:MAG: GNAT family N-acetyltransferase [Betaproteobacteria bacterium]|nr:GNAT family N-acetyltransferase [Betaproteobacteria bacterium]